MSTIRISVATSSSPTTISTKSQKKKKTSSGSSTSSRGITIRAPEKLPDVSSFSKEKMEAVGKLQKLFGKIAIQNKFRKRVDEYRKSDVTKSARTRLQVINEIISTEKTYYFQLKSLVEDYYPMFVAKAISSSGMVDNQQVKTLFGNASALRSLHKMIYDHFKSRKEKFPINYSIGDIFQEMIPALKIYVEYVNGCTSALKVYQVLSTHKEFGPFLDSIRKGTVEELPSLLIAPVQRLPRYELLIREALKHTLPDHRDYLLLKKALADVTEMNIDINAKKAQQERSMKLIEVQSRVTSAVDSSWQLSADDLEQFVDSVDISYSEGPNRKKSGHIYLFKNYLLLTLLKVTFISSKQHKRNNSNLGSSGSSSDLIAGFGSGSSGNLSSSGGFPGAIQKKRGRAVRTLSMTAQDIKRRFSTASEVPKKTITHTLDARIPLESVKIDLDGVKGITLTNESEGSFWTLFFPSAAYDGWSKLIFDKVNAKRNELSLSKLSPPTQALQHQLHAAVTELAVTKESLQQLIAKLSRVQTELTHTEARLVGANKELSRLTIANETLENENQNLLTALSTRPTSPSLSPKQFQPSSSSPSSPRLSLRLAAQRGAEAATLPSKIPAQDDNDGGKTSVDSEKTPVDAGASAASETLKVAGIEYQNQQDAITSLSLKLLKAEKAKSELEKQLANATVSSLSKSPRRALPDVYTTSDLLNHYQDQRIVKTSTLSLVFPHKQKQRPSMVFLFRKLLLISLPVKGGKSPSPLSRGMSTYGEVAIGNLSVSNPEEDSTILCIEDTESHSSFWLDCGSLAVKMDWLRAFKLSLKKFLKRELSTIETAPPESDTTTTDAPYLAPLPRAGSRVIKPGGGMVGSKSMSHVPSSSSSSPSSKRKPTGRGGDLEAIKESKASSSPSRTEKKHGLKKGLSRMSLQFKETFGSTPNPSRRGERHPMVHSPSADSLNTRTKSKLKYIDEDGLVASRNSADELEDPFEFLRKTAPQISSSPSPSSTPEKSKKDKKVKSFRRSVYDLLKTDESSRRSGTHSPSRLSAYDLASPAASSSSPQNEKDEAKSKRNTTTSTSTRSTLPTELETKVDQISGKGHGDRMAREEEGEVEREGSNDSAEVFLSPRSEIKEAREKRSNPLRSFTKKASRLINLNSPASSKVSSPPPSPRKKEGEGYEETEESDDKLGFFDFLSSTDPAAEKKATASRHSYHFPKPVYPDLNPPSPRELDELMSLKKSPSSEKSRERKRQKNRENLQALAFPLTPRISKIINDDELREMWITYVNNSFITDTWNFFILSRTYQITRSRTRRRALQGEIIERFLMPESPEEIQLDESVVHPIINDYSFHNFECSGDPRIFDQCLSIVQTFLERETTSRFFKRPATVAYLKNQVVLLKRQLDEAEQERVEMEERLIDVEIVEKEDPTDQDERDDVRSVDGSDSAGDSVSDREDGRKDGELGGDEKKAIDAQEGGGGASASSSLHTLPIIASPSSLPNLPTFSSTGPTSAASSASSSPRKKHFRSKSSLTTSSPPSTSPSSSPSSFSSPVTVVDILPRKNLILYLHGDANRKVPIVVGLGGHQSLQEVHEFAAREMGLPFDAITIRLGTLKLEKKHVSFLMEHDIIDAVVRK